MVDCRHLTKTYQDGEVETKALREATFTIKAGEFVAITGPSGSGKSTLMHILGCLDTPTSGTYFLDNHDVSGLSDDELSAIRNKRLGFVFQSFNLLPRVSVLRNVALPLVYAGIPEAEREAAAIGALRAAAFPEQFWHHQPNQLSGGMMQRVAIARALVNEPLIILADEPTGNLDTKTGEIVLETFQRLHADLGRTIILITHEPYVAEHAERVLNVRDGRLESDKKNTNRRLLHRKT